jgi:hypothetical protein
VFAVHSDFLLESMAGDNGASTTDMEPTMDTSDSGEISDAVDTLISQSACSDPDGNVSFLQQGEAPRQGQHTCRIGKHHHQKKKNRKVRFRQKTGSELRAFRETTDPYPDFHDATQGKDEVWALYTSDTFSTRVRYRDDHEVDYK